MRALKAPAARGAYAEARPNGRSGGAKTAKCVQTADPEGDKTAQCAQTADPEGAKTTKCKQTVDPKGTKAAKC